MKLSDDVYLQGPLTPVEPRDPYERSVLNHAEYGEDFQREQYFRNLMVGMPRRLTVVERWAAEEDPGVAPRVYAPAWERVSKPPLPWDAEILAAGRTHTITAEAALHPGDRSDPAELQ
jgi:hypothetical protein